MNVWPQQNFAHYHLAFAACYKSSKPIPLSGGVACTEKNYEQLTKALIGKAKLDFVDLKKFLLERKKSGTTMPAVGKMQGFSKQISLKPPSTSQSLQRIYKLKRD